MALSVQDLDALLGYDPATHSVKGMPTLTQMPPKPGTPDAMPSITPGAPNMHTPAAVRAAAAPENIAAANTLAPARPVAAIPSVGGSGVPPGGAAAPVAPEVGIPSVGANAATLPGEIPTLAKPTVKQSIATGAAQDNLTPKAEGVKQWGEMKPQTPEELGIKPFTPEYYEQQRRISDFDKAHPLGGDISEKPGIWGKIEHGLAKAGSIAGEVIAPGVMRNIPGTDANNVEQRNAEQRGWTTANEGQLKEAQGTAAKEMADLVPWTDPANGQTSLITRGQWGKQQEDVTKAGATTGAAQIRADASTANTAAKDETAKGIAADRSKDQLLKMGFDEKGHPLPDDQLSSQQRATRDLTTTHARLQEAQAELERAKSDPNSPVFKAAQAGLALRSAELQQKLQDAGYMKPSGQTQSRGEAAGAALALLPGLEKTIADNASSFGPIMGRINRGEIKLGDVDPKVQEAYSQLESFYALQPSVHGFRNAEFVKDFDTFIGNLQTNPDAVIAGLHGLEPTLKAVEESGRTMQPKIFAGQPGGAAPGAAAPAAAAAPGGLPPGFKPVGQ
jgi:hypothetical protein